MNPRKALKLAVDRAGGQSALGKEIGVGQTTINYWLNTSKKGVPAEYASKIERLTGVGRHELRPDVFPPPVPAGTPVGNVGAPAGGGHFSQYKHLRRDHFKSAEDVEQHIRALREEWSHR